MRKKIFFWIGILLVCLAGWGIYKVSKPHTNVEGEQAVAALSARNLYSEYQKAENLANKKWLGKVIEVNGIISSVSESGDYVSINLVATADGGINCSILKKDLNADDKFKKGDSITIKGKCTGFLMDVNLVDCVVEKQ
jgi:hypothetical protein